MSLTVRDIADFMGQLAPLELKESYDNVGLMVGNPDDEIKGILIALDCTLEVIEEAKEKNLNLILTHHPLLFKKPSVITTENLQGKKIIELIKNNINLYSSHTNLDSVGGGMNDTILKLLGFDSFKILEQSKLPAFKENSGIGRIIELDYEIELEELCQRLKDKLNLKFLRISKGSKESFKSIAIINGSGQDYFDMCKKQGVECVITGDTTYHYVSDYREMGMTIIDIGHFNSEWPVFKLLAKNLEMYLDQKKSLIRLEYSLKCEDPYEIK